MGASKKIKMALLDKGMTQKELSDRLGYIGKNTVYNLLGRDSLSFEAVERWADVIGCDVVLRDRASGKIYD